MLNVMEIKQHALSILGFALYAAAMVTVHMLFVPAINRAGLAQPLLIILLGAGLGIVAREAATEALAVRRGERKQVSRLLLWVVIGGMVVWVIAGVGPQLPHELKLAFYVATAAICALEVVLAQRRRSRRNPDAAPDASRPGPN